MSEPAETFLEAAAAARGEPLTPTPAPSAWAVREAVRQLRREAARRRQPEAQRDRVLSAADAKRERRRRRNLDATPPTGDTDAPH